MHQAYNKFDKVTFSNKHLRLKKKLEMFVCMVIPAGIYPDALNDTTSKIEVIWSYY